MDPISAAVFPYFVRAHLIVCVNMCLHEYVVCSTSQRR